MIELTPFAGLLEIAGIVYLLLAAAGIAIALWKGKTWARKLGWAGLVLALFAMPIGPDVYRSLEDRMRYLKAKALFDERCKSGGEKIFRKVENVESVLLLNVRQYDADKSNPQMAGAAAAHEFYGDDYVRSFLLYESEPDSSGTRKLLQDSSISSRPGYRFVDVVDPVDQRRYRYSLGRDGRMLREVPIGRMPRFGVTFEDHVNLDERKYWIASSTVKVIDLGTHEALGEFARRVVDPGQGSQIGQRTPWLFANGCNMKTSYGSYSPRLFVDQILKPIDGTSK